MHRFIWDLHYPPPPGPRQFPIAAIYRDTPSTPAGPWVLPGQYTVRLTVGGKSQEQPLTVKLDPRVKTAAEALTQQFELSQQCCEDLRQVHEALAQVEKLKGQLKELQAKVKEPKLAEALAELGQKAAVIEGSARRRGERPAPGKREPSLLRLTEELSRLLDVLQGADAAPTTQAVAACGQIQKDRTDLLASWHELTEKDVKAMNERLRKADLPLLAP
jgi:hypothetical protein